MMNDHKCLYRIFIKKDTLEIKYCSNGRKHCPKSFKNAVSVDESGPETNSNTFSFGDYTSKEPVMTTLFATLHCLADE